MRPPKTPWLDLWHLGVKHGVMSAGAPAITSGIFPLWQAACWEQAALEAHAQKSYKYAIQCLDRALTIIARDW